MSVRIVCKFCGSNIDAHEKLLGQTRPCPKCKNPILIVPAQDTKVQIAVPQTVPVPSANPVDEAPAIGSAVRYIKRLIPGDLYVIVNHERTVAYWKAGDGWLYNIGTGFVSAKRNINEIPEHGEYVLVEGFVHQTENGQRLKGLRFFMLGGPAVLVSIGRSETEILEKIVRPCSLTPANKRFFLKFVRDHYFNQFTEDFMDAVEFLTNDDVHTRELGDTTSPSGVELQ
ncbi:MAG: hypothetical protein Q4G69_04035 [Planctomycetia bacterium]|nr:hypothetical protein [Planctomycetia bacterium]